MTDVIHHYIDGQVVEAPPPVSPRRHEEPLRVRIRFFAFLRVFAPSR